MTKEDYDFFIDNDCSVGEHVFTRVSYHDMVVDIANHLANGEPQHELPPQSRLCCIYLVAAVCSAKVIYTHVCSCTAYSC